MSEWQYTADPKPGIKSAAACPSAASHTPMPSGYLGWHAVAEKRRKAGQRQTQCKSCGFLSVWVDGKTVPDWPRAPEPR